MNNSIKVNGEQAVKGILGKEQKNIHVIMDHISDTFTECIDAKGLVALEKGIDPTEVTTLDVAEFVLRHFDTYQIAADNPEVASATWKVVSQALGMFNPYCVIPAILVNALPDKLAAGVVQVSGFLTPEHLIHMGLNYYLKKAQEEPSIAEEELK